MKEVWKCCIVKESMNITDEQLVAQYLKGDEKSLELLIQKYLNPIYSFVLQYTKERDEAEDLTQEVFVKVWKNINKFKSEYKFKTWLFTIAKNTSLDFLKKKKVVSNFSELENNSENYSFSESLASKIPSILELLKKEESAQELNFAVNQLSPNYRATLKLRYNEGLKFKEIAETLGESIDTIKTRHRRAIKALKNIFG